MMVGRNLALMVDERLMIDCLLVQLMILYLNLIFWGIIRRICMEERYNFQIVSTQFLFLFVYQHFQNCMYLS